MSTIIPYMLNCSLKSLATQFLLRSPTKIDGRCLTHHSPKENLSQSVLSPHFFLNVDWYGTYENEI